MAPSQNGPYQNKHTAHAKHQNATDKPNIKTKIFIYLILRNNLICWFPWQPEFFVEFNFLNNYGRASFEALPCNLAKFDGEVV